jgi:hypothetical protein
LEELRKDAMIVPDNRHWIEFARILNSNFLLNEKTVLKEFWDFDLYNPKTKEQIEELTEKAS